MMRPRGGVALSRRPRGAAWRWAGFCIALALIAYLLWGLVGSDHGYLVYRRELQRVRQLQAQVERLRDKRECLARAILRLRHDPKALEELAHRELGYVYPDEYMLVVPEGRKPGIKGQGGGAK